MALKITDIVDEHISDPSQQVGGIIYRIVEVSDPEIKTFARLGCNIASPDGCIFKRFYDARAEDLQIAECRILSSRISDIVECGKMPTVKREFERAQDPFNLRR